MRESDKESSPFGIRSTPFPILLPVKKGGKMVKSEIRILIADDDPAIRNLLTLELRDEGYEVISAENGEQALTILGENQVDLIILDIMMPEKDGWEVCKAIRDREYGTRQKIVMLTGRDTARDRMVGTGLLGADEYVTKPFGTEELIEIIEKVLER